jgi:hypothetical protein
MAEDKYNTQEIIQKFNAYRSYKESVVIPEWRLIHSLFAGKFWDVFKTYIEDFTITPETNYLEYHVQAFMNSVYSGSFIGTLSPVKAGEEQRIQDLNEFLQYDWFESGIKNKYLDIGRMGELYNFGPARVESIDKDGKIVIKVLTQDEVYVDPQVTSYRDGEAIFIERAMNIDTLKNDSDFGDKVTTYDAENKGENYVNKTLTNKLEQTNAQVNTKNRMVSLIECFIRNKDGGIDQIYILDEKEIVFVKENLAIGCFPIEIYQPDRPEGGPYGSSKLTKILNTVIALNLLDSLEATQPYRIVNRPRFVNVAGQIDMRAFADFGNTPGSMFPVNGNPREIVYYQDVAVLPDMTILKNRLEQSIFNITGVDAAYRGRMTNSVQTTGATQAFQARVSMLTDNSRITMLEEFTENLTRLVIKFYIEHAGDREYSIPKYSEHGTGTIVKETKVNFMELKQNKVKFKYTIAASTLLPMNQANLFDAAKALYEMQGQYGFKVPIVTEEDLVRFSDFPQKNLWLQRIAKQKLNDVKTDVESTFKNAFLIYQKLLQEGMTDAQAAEQAINILVAEKQQIAADPSMGRGFE